MEEDFYIYIKQDGMYTTQEILITDKLVKNLPRDWYNAAMYKSMELAVKYAYKTYFTYYDEVDCIHIDLEDKYKLYIDDIKIMIPEVFI